MPRTKICVRIPVRIAESSKVALSAPTNREFQGSDSRQLLSGTLRDGFQFNSGECIRFVMLLHPAIVRPWVHRQFCLPRDSYLRPSRHCFAVGFEPTALLMAQPVVRPTMHRPERMSYLDAA